MADHLTVRLHTGSHWTLLPYNKVRDLVAEKATVASRSRASEQRARADLGLLLLFLRRHVIRHMGGHGAWGPVLQEIGLNYKVAQRAVESAVQWADKSIVGRGGVKLAPVCGASVLAEAAQHAYPESFSGKAAAFDAERAAWLGKLASGRAAARLAGGDRVKQRAIELFAGLPLWTAAAQEKLQRGGMAPQMAARVLRALEVLRQAAEEIDGKQDQPGAAVRARTA